MEQVKIDMKSGDGSDTDPPIVDRRRGVNMRGAIFVVNRSPPRVLADLRTPISMRQELNVIVRSMKSIAYFSLSLLLKINKN